MIPLYQGDSKFFSVAVQDKSQPQNPDGSYPPFDLTGCSIKLKLVKGAKDTEVASVDGSIVGNPLAGNAGVLLDRTTSSAVPPGSYSLRVEVLKSTDVQNTVYVDTLKVT